MSSIGDQRVGKVSMIRSHVLIGTTGQPIASFRHGWKQRLLMFRLVDEDTEERAQIALQASPIHALRTLRVMRDGESLIIEGRVPTFYYKQLAQEAVRAVARDHAVINRIDVD